MLYLKKIITKNFRQLRDIELDFGVNETKPLTVIRAENRTGKTTFLTAISWALFGDDAFRSRSKYRMHPIDWDEDVNGLDVDISVEIHFSSEDEDTLHKDDFILKRECTERISKESKDKFDVSSKDPVLTKLTEGGYESIPNPSAYITRRLFTLSLKDIFITDGDKTLSFIDSDDTLSTRKTRVKKAVRSLMQLEALERSEVHLKEIRREISRVIDYNSNAGSEDSGILTDYNDLELELADFPGTIEGIEDAYEQALELSSTLESELEQAYAKAGGDPGEKQQTLTNYKDLLTEELAGISDQYSRMSIFLRNEVHMLYSHFCKSDINLLGDHLGKMISDGVIPDIVPRLAKERLLADTCICGLKISEHPEVMQRFEKLAGSGSNNETTMFLLQLKHDIANWEMSSDSEIGFLRHGNDCLSSIVRHRSNTTRLENGISDISAQLDMVRDIDIDSLRSRRSIAQKEEKELTEQLARLKADQRSKEIRLIELKKKRDQILKKEGKRDIAEDKLMGIDDMLRVISTTIHALGGDTLVEVSTVMNDIFKKINVQDGNVGSVIESVSITEEHEIVVSGINGRKLIPSTDISGAQKRALTLAFIFATVQVSGAELPNIIDTPLGTQSGELKRLMLRYTALNSKQAVLLLTPSEIAGVEEEIREYTSRYWTLSHADQYPKELVNLPPVDTKSAYLCSCDIWSSCVKCARHVRGGL